MKKQNMQTKFTIKQLCNTMIFVMPEHDFYHVLEENEDIIQILSFRVWMFVILIPALRLLQIHWETVETVFVLARFPINTGINPGVNNKKT